MEHARPQVTGHRFTVEEFEQLAAVPAFGEDALIELIDGEIVDMAPIGSRHAACVKRLANRFAARLAERAVVSVQDPLRLGDLTEVQPDVMLLRPRDDFYAAGHPGPSDVLLLVEVADTSLLYDRDRKLPLYAAAAVPEVWLVDLDGRRVQAHRPGSATAVHVPGDTIAPTSFPDLAIPVTDLVGS